MARLRVPDAKPPKEIKSRRQSICHQALRWQEVAIQQLKNVFGPLNQIRHLMYSHAVLGHPHQICPAFVDRCAEYRASTMYAADHTIQSATQINPTQRIHTGGIELSANDLLLLIDVSPLSCFSRDCSTF